MVRFLGLNNSCNRFWRITCADFDSIDMIGVYTSLEWLYCVLRSTKVKEEEKQI